MFTDDLKLEAIQVASTIERPRILQTTHGVTFSDERKNSTHEMKSLLQIAAEASQQLVELL